MSRIQPLTITVCGLLPLAGTALGAGDTDGRGLSARFRRPEGLALLQDGTLVAADAEAHTIRLVTPDGTVTCLGVPGEPGHADGGPGEAPFRSPGFVTALPGGAFLVSDTGNHVIRKITPQGAVTTVAGLPGKSGHRDGPGGQAAFNALKGLALRLPGTLFAVDGRCVRQIHSDGRVTTVCGDPGRPSPQPAAGGPGTPLLDAPHGILVRGERLLVTDRGSRTLLAIDPASPTATRMTTLLGDRALAGPRNGLFRNGIAGPLGDEFAALADPRGLVADPRGDLYVADGTCIVHGSSPNPGVFRKAPAILVYPWMTVRRGEPMTLDFFGPSPLSRIPGVNLDFPAHFFWTLDALDPAGRPVIPRVRGEQRGGNHGRTVVTFEEKGPVHLLLTCVMADGVPAQASATLTVE